MGIGKVKVSNFFIADALNFPKDWEIRSIIPNGDDRSEMLIVGPEFPSVSSNGDIEEVRIIYHKAAITCEVERL